MSAMSVTDLAQRALAEAIEITIAESGISAYAVSQRIGVADTTITRYIRGLRTPKAHEISAIELAVGIPGGSINTLAQEILYAELHDVVSVVA
jgi:ribosome-binding protein aMBF1 (putative translation factor)